MHKLNLSLFALAALGAVGCAQVPDADEDLLSDDFEIAIGTNPEIADSDGDGFTDAEEWLGYYNPQDRDDAPWQGQYVRFPSPGNNPNLEPLDGDGWSVGDVSNNWTKSDQFGDDLDLHDFYGQVILIDIGAEWCVPCQNAAPEAQDTYEELRDRGFIVLNLLLDGTTNDTPPDVDRWLEAYDLTFPIFDDFDQEVVPNYIDSEGGSFSIPNFSILDRNMEVVELYATGTANYELVEDLLDEDPPSVEWPLPENTVELRESLGIEFTQEDPHLDANIELGIELGGAAVSGGGSSAGSGDSESGSLLAPRNGDGTFAGAPFGGTSCSTLGSPASPGLAWLLVLLGGLALQRRKAGPAAV